MPETDIQVRLLQRSDDRSGFRSGNVDLDRYFQRYAGQNQFRHHLGTTYVAVTAERVCGFVTITPGELTADSIPRSVRARLPAYPLPILRISRLAVDERDQGKGIGGLLLKAMFGLALELRDRFGCMGVVVDAKPCAVGFCESLGFITLEVLSGDLGDTAASIFICRSTPTRPLHCVRLATFPGRQPDLPLLPLRPRAVVSRSRPDRRGDPWRVPLVTKWPKPAVGNV